MSTCASKTVNGVVHNYTVSGSLILTEEWGTNLVVYLYDANGEPIGMRYRTSSMAEGVFYTFWFEKNAQGDVVAVYNETGTKVLSYSYDAWGNKTTTVHNSSGSNSYAQYNAITYRGYYHDTETGFYYLQSRYYDPTTGRFINADSYASTGQGLLGYNMFAYCRNNSVSRKDASGNADACVIAIGEDSNPFIDIMGPRGGGGGGGSSYALAGFSSAKGKIEKVSGFVTNKSENEAVTQQQLQTNGVCFYKDTMVVRVDALGKSCVSFGIILMGGGNLGQPDFSKTLNHEYGHAVHLKQIGGLDYLTTTAVPSLIGAAIASNNRSAYNDYYNQPWERVADRLGGVDRGYLPGANTAGTLFWIFTIVASLVTPY